MSTIAPSKPTHLILYHAHCIDGYTAAWACRKGLIETSPIHPDMIDTLPAEYHLQDTLLEIISKYQVCYVVDFSLPVAMLEKLASLKVVMFVLDHHKTAFDMYLSGSREYNQYLGHVAGASVHLDILECGASLVWKHFFGAEEKEPNLISYVKDYDLWQKNLTGCDEINKYLNTIDKEPATWTRAARLLEHDFTKALHLGTAMQTYHDKIVASIVSTAMSININGIHGLVANCSPEFSSDVGHALALESKTYGATYHQVEGCTKFSLRSTDEFLDVSELARAMGGGGHRNAAGFVMKDPEDQKSGVTIWGLADLEEEVEDSSNA